MKFFIGLLIFFTFNLVKADCSSPINLDHQLVENQYEKLNTTVFYSFNDLESHDLDHDQRSTSSTQASNSQECCKVCKKGKACGDACISRKYTCRKPPGCACDE